MSSLHRAGPTSWTGVHLAPSHAQRWLPMRDVLTVKRCVQLCACMLTEHPVSITVSCQAADRCCCVRRLQSCMDAAASTVPDVHTENGVEHSNASRTLRPLIKAIEMVFGSAAALSATFGYKVTSMLLLPGPSLEDFIQRPCQH